MASCPVPAGETMREQKEKLGEIQMWHLFWQGEESLKMHPKFGKFILLTY